jgi:hypothetical protein
VRIPWDRRLARRAARTVAPAGLAVAGFALLPLPSVDWLGVVAGWAALAVVVAASHSRPLGQYTAARAVVAAGFLAHAHPATGTDWALVVTGVLLLGLLLHETALRGAAGTRFRTANLRLTRRVLDPSAIARAAGFANTGLIALVGPLVIWSLPAWPLLVAALGTAAVSGLLFADAWNRRRRNRGSDLAVMREALERHQPRFILYFSSVAGMEYQATMWLPYLERIGEPFAVLLRESHALSTIAAATRAPVVVCPSLAALDAAMVPSIQAAFYVNNGMKNGHCVRFSHVTHVQLLHGDSDKAPSYNPVTAMYDRIFVAGQAGIDRYAANGVRIPLEKFRIVGRPQVESVRVSDRPIGELTDRTVLYAPTWIGLYADVNYSSLPIAERIVRGLLERGATVILRHHPFAKRDRRSAIRLERVERILAEDRARTGRPHLWGRAATEDLTLFDCVNRSDAMISDVSAVVSDYLYSGKPFAITDMVDERDDFPRTFPLARVAYVLRRDAGNLTEVLDQLLERDPLAAPRREVRTYYLGDLPPDRYAEAFLAEARRCLEADPGPSPTGDREPVAATTNVTG